MATAWDIPQTIEMLIDRRPVLEPILRAFGPLAQARDDIRGELEGELAKSGVEVPGFDPEMAAKGQPVMEKMGAKGMGGAIGQAAEKLLPLLPGRESLARHKAALEIFFLEPPEESDPREELLEALLSENSQTLEKLARQAGLPPAILAFAADFILSAVLRALTAPLRKKGQPWDVEGAWSQGYCPVCGAFPIIAWLDRKIFDEKNAFLAGGGGKKHFHCSMCGSSWKFRRAVCPSCGGEGEGAMQILKESGAYGEKLEFCKKCQTYCPTIDLREMEKTPNMDIMAIGLMHLDMAAAERKLFPLRQSFWNTF